MCDLLGCTLQADDHFIAVYKLRSCKSRVFHIQLGLIVQMAQQRFDQFYLTICKQVGGIEGFVRSFFDFLFRKTDFFYECDPGDKMGFPPGYNKQMIAAIMDQFQKEHYKKIPQKSLEDYNKKVQAAKAKQQQTVEKSKPQNDKNEKKQETAVASQPKSEEKKSEGAAIVNTYNGGTNQKYSWSQQIRQVEVTIQIEAGITSKNINVDLRNEKVSIGRKTGEVLIEGELYEKINAGESVWKIQKSGGKTFLVLNLEKADEKIWNTVFKGDPEIDTSKVNNTKPLTDFDEETQGAIRKIMYEQQRKQMGLPTTEEQKQLEALKLAWNAEGSPFKGQPFDPSKFNLSGSQFQP